MKLNIKSSTWATIPNISFVWEFVEMEFWLHLNILCIKHIRAPEMVSVLLHCFFWNRKQCVFPISKKLVRIYIVTYVGIYYLLDICELIISSLIIELRLLSPIKIYFGTIFGVYSKCMQNHGSPTAFKHVIISNSMHLHLCRVSAPYTKCNWFPCHPILCQQMCWSELYEILECDSSKTS